MCIINDYHINTVSYCCHVYDYNCHYHVSYPWMIIIISVIMSSCHHPYPYPATPYHHHMYPRSPIHYSKGVISHISVHILSVICTMVISHLPLITGQSMGFDETINRNLQLVGGLQQFYFSIYWE